MRFLLLCLLLVPLAAAAQTATVETIAPPFQATVIAPDGSAIGGVSTVYTEVDFNPNPLRYYQHYPAVWVDGQVHRLSIPSEYVPGSLSVQVPVWVMYLSEDADLIYGNAGSVVGQISGGVVRWDGVGGAMTFVEGLPQTWRTEMMAASRDGSVLAGVHREFQNDFAWRWEDGTVTELEDFFLDGSTTEILDVDDQGRVFGARQTFSGGAATWTSLVWDTDGRPTVGESFSGVLVGVSGDGTTLVVNAPSAQTRGFLVREDETIPVDSLRLGRTRPIGLVSTPNPWVFPGGSVSHNGTTLYGSFIGDPVNGIPTRSDWLWREGIGRVPIGQLLEEQYGLQIPECSVGFFYGVMSADGRTLTAQCAESVTPAPNETAYVITLPASASWAEAASGFFDDPDRWAPARVPDALTLTRFDASGTESPYTVTLRDDQTLPSITVAIPDGEVLAAPVDLDIGGHTLTLSPQSAALDALVVGDQTDGSLFLTGSGRVHPTAGVTIGRGGTALGQILSFVDLDIDGPLVVGDGAENTAEAASTLGIFSGTTTARVGFDVGLQAGTNAAIVVEPGASLQVPTASVSTLGFAGTGQLIATNAFVSHTGPLTLGRLATGAGTLDLRSGSDALVTDSLVVGLAGIGQMEIVGGSGLTTGPAVLGSRTGSVGSVRVTGVGSEWDIAGDLLNGAEGAAVLEVVEGASLCVGGIGFTGEQGRFLSDETIRLGFDACTGAPRTGSGSARHHNGDTSGGISLGGLAVADGGEVVAPAIEVGPDGVLDGAGALAVPITNGGTLAPGGPEALGTLALAASLAQSADGVLAIEVGTDAADRLTVEGAVTLGGTLRVSALPGSTPPVGATYDVLTATAFTGAFARIEAQEGLSVSVGATAVTVTVTSVVANEDEAVPEALALGAPYPNPVAGRAVLAYALSEAGPVRLALYDLLGRTVAVLAEGTQAAGRYEAALDAAALSGGVYVARLEAGGTAQTRRLTVVR